MQRLPQKSSVVSVAKAFQIWCRRTAHDDDGMIVLHRIMSKTGSNAQTEFMFHICLWGNSAPP